MLIYQRLIDLILDQVFIMSQVHLAMKFLLEPKIIPVELPLNSIVGPDVCYSRDS
jgi:hypothetical protein